MFIKSYSAFSLHVPLNTAYLHSRAEQTFGRLDPSRTW